MTTEWYEGMFWYEGMLWYEGMFWGEENILCLDCGNCMTIHICQDYQNCIPKTAKFSVFNSPTNSKCSLFPTSEQQGQDLFSKTPIK